MLTGCRQAAKYPVDGGAERWQLLSHSAAQSRAEQTSTGFQTSQVTGVTIMLLLMAKFHKTVNDSFIFCSNGNIGEACLL